MYREQQSAERGTAERLAESHRGGGGESKGTDPYKYDSSRGHVPLPIFKVKVVLIRPRPLEVMRHAASVIDKQQEAGHIQDAYEAITSLPVGL